MWLQGEKKGCECINCINTTAKESEDLLDVAVDEYLEEVTAEITGVPGDSNDILDWVFGEDLEESEWNVY